MESHGYNARVGGDLRDGRAGDFELGGEVSRRVDGATLVVLVGKKL